MKLMNGLEGLTVIKRAVGRTIVANTVVTNGVIHKKSNRPIAQRHPMSCRIALVARRDWK